MTRDAHIITSARVYQEQVSRKRLQNSKTIKGHSSLLSKNDQMVSNTAHRTTNIDAAPEEDTSDPTLPSAHPTAIPPALRATALELVRSILINTGGRSSGSPNSVLGGQQMSPGHLRHQPMANRSLSSILEEAIEICEASDIHNDHP